MNFKILKEEPSPFNLDKIAMMENFGAYIIQLSGDSTYYIVSMGLASKLGLNQLPLGGIRGAVHDAAEQGLKNGTIV